MSNDPLKNLDFELPDPQAPPPPRLFPEDELWTPPADCPDWLVAEYMPTPDVATTDLAWRILFYPSEPVWWNAQYGLRVVNLRRRFVYDQWKQGEMDWAG